MGSTRNIARKSSIGGLTFVQGGFDIENLMKTPLIYVSYFNFGGLVLCLGRLNPPKPTRGHWEEARKVAPSKMAKFLLQVQPRLTKSHPRRLNLSCQQISHWTQLRSLLVHQNATLVYAKITLETARTAVVITR